MGDFPESLTPPPSHHHHSSRVLPVREDCWSEEATSTLIEAWGSRYLELNRGNLRQKDWREVAETVNDLHGHSKKTHRTDVQCKNRVDTIKKKYKVEKARVSSSNGTLTSSWIFYDRLDVLIGSSGSSMKKPSPPSPPVALPLPYKKTVFPLAVAFPQKRPANASDDGYFRRNYSAMAAAAAADVEEDEEEEEEEEEGERKSEDEEKDDKGEGMRRLAKAIEGFGEAYQRLEAEKLRQMIDLEKQRMQFAKDLEMQRMQMFMDTQVQLERIKRRKHSGSNDNFASYMLMF